MQCTRAIHIAKWRYCRPQCVIVRHGFSEHTNICSAFIALHHRWSIGSHWYVLSLDRVQGLYNSKAYSQACGKIAMSKLKHVQPWEYYITQPNVGC